MFRNLTLIGLLALATACARPAYVHHGGEFNRSSSDFGKDVIDIEQVTVCYSSRGSTPAQVRALATEECAKVGKTAQFVEQNYANCPLQTPVSAIFSCLGDGVGESSGPAADRAGGTGGHQVNYDGILFSY